MKKSFIYLFFGLCFTVGLTSCSKKMSSLPANYFSVTPQPLEVVNNQIDVSISGNIPPKYFLKDAKLSFTPILRHAYGEIAGETFTFQGENVAGNDKTISYEKGGNIQLNTSFKYRKELASCELFLQIKMNRNGKKSEMPLIKIGEGVIATSMLATPLAATPAIAPDKFQRIMKEKRDASILFIIQQANLRSGELNKDEIKALHKAIEAASKAENQRVSELEISSYASPDGGIDLNERLAADREKNTVAYMQKEMSKNAIYAPVDAHYTAQDWEGFKELVEKSNIQDKDIILRVLSMYSDPEQREREIKNISVTYRDLANQILPQLRRSRLTATIETIGKSDEQISSLAASNPKSLTIEELLYAASLEKEPDDKAVVYRITSELYPNDYRSFNNLGALLFQNGEMPEAVEMFSKAHRLNPSAPEANMNNGLIALSNNKTTEAQEFFGKSSGVPELGAVMGLLYTQTGNYSQAVNAYGNEKNNNAAVAQILAKDYNKAQATLLDVQNKDAVTDYLMAIVGARTNNASVVINSLRDAISKDSSLAKKAASDMEFYKYFKSEAFLHIVK